MFFHQGELLAASTGNLTGQDAAFDIINWENPEIEIENVCKVKPEDRDIEVPLGFLLIESARMKDEQNKPVVEADAGESEDTSPSAPADQAVATEVDEIVFTDNTVELETAGFEVKIRIEKGYPVKEILKVEKEEAVSAIVLGSHGRNNIRGARIGSVSEKVIRRAVSTVLIVKR